MINVDRNYHTSIAYFKTIKYLYVVRLYKSRQQKSFKLIICNKINRIIIFVKENIFLIMCLYLSPLLARNQAYRRVSCLPWDKTRRQCPVAGSKERTRNTSGDRPTPALYVPPAKVPTLGRSPRISSRNACHTNNIQYFHITFTH